MTIEEFQLLAWLQVGKAVVSVMLYTMFILGITRIYKQIGMRLGGIHDILRVFLVFRVFALLVAVSNLTQTLAKPEEVIQQYMEQQQKRTSGSLFEVPKEESFVKQVPL